MWRIALILLGFSLNGPSNAAMMDGQELKEATFANVAYIQNKAPPHDTHCIGAVFNSFTVFTSDMCKLDVNEPAKYRVMPATEAVKKGFAVTSANAFDVVKVETFKKSNFTGIFHTKIIRIAPPGMMVGKEVTASAFVTDWEDWLNIVRPNRTGRGAVVSASIPQKAGAVEYQHVDDYQCNATYNAQHEPNWPQFMAFEHFCVFKGQHAFNATFGSIAPGMPCEDSYGSPVFARDQRSVPVVLGILLVTKCSAVPPFAVAIASPDFTVDTHYTPTPPTPGNITDFPTSFPLITTEKRRTQKPKPHVGPGGKPYSRAASIIPMWSAVVFTGVYLGL